MNRLSVVTVALHGFFRTASLLYLLVSQETKIAGVGQGGHQAGRPSGRGVGSALQWHAQLLHAPVGVRMRR